MMQARYDPNTAEIKEDIKNDLIPAVGNIDTDTDNLAVIDATLTAGFIGLATILDSPAQEDTLSSIDGKLAVLGQKASIGSVPVVIASDQSNIVVDLPADAATETTVGDIKTSVQTMDDWDENDRCKANIIAGQAGVAGNIGAADALTQRIITAEYSWSRVGAVRLTLAGGNQAITVPATTTLVRLSVEGGDIRYDLGQAATNISVGYLPAGVVEYIPMIGSGVAGQIQVFGPVGSFANALFLKKA